MLTIGTLFSGFEGVGVGARAAGIQHAWGLEVKPEVAEVAAANGFETRVGDILTAAPRQFAAVDILHASPPCPNFSIAKTGATETPHDIALAAAVCDFIKTLRPRYFTLENVSLYRQSRSFQAIQHALASAGYFSSYALINAADYGVPQTRRRLFLWACRAALLPALPASEQWQGWYTAVADLLPYLPEVELAPWQISRIPAFLARVSSVLDDQHSASASGLTIRTAPSPMFTVSATQTNRSIRAVLFPATGHTGPVYGGAPRLDTEPCQTIRDSKQGIARAWLADTRTVAMSPRALARFQTFPDWYTLPPQNRLACYGIGNAVPPIMFKKIIQELTQC